ncbi:MAG: N-acetyltransferase [Desulfosudaceae bacterium]
MIRKARITDIPRIHRLLSDFAEKGFLLARPLSKLYDDIRDFFVFADEADQVLGCCALQICWEDLAEIRSLAVQPDHWGRQIGTRLVESAFADAAAYDIKKIFVLTYSPVFFKKFGFFRIDKTQLPLKIWSDCITCVKFPNCDETAMMRLLE